MSIVPVAPQGATHQRFFEKTHYRLDIHLPDSLIVQAWLKLVALRHGGDECQGPRTPENGGYTEVYLSLFIRVYQLLLTITCMVTVQIISPLVTPKLLSMCTVALEHICGRILTFYRLVCPMPTLSNHWAFSCSSIAPTVPTSNRT